jgi:hypothetical protein
MAHESLATQAQVETVARRIVQVQPASTRQWGTMSPHEMLCHLADSFASVLGERTASPNETWLSRTVVKWIALHTSMQWPKGVQTRPEVNPKASGTKPVDFERDRARVLELLRRFAQPETRYARHPIFGELTRDEWMIWGYRHCDHHLRQFGL